MDDAYIIEMLGITKEFPGIRANDNITLQLKKGEIHALLGENGAGKSTLMSILFGLIEPTKGVIKKNGEVVHITNPNDANALNIGMVHQHFKLVECFSVLDNIILGEEPTKGLFLEKDAAREKVMKLSESYGLKIDPDAIISDVTVGMQQRTEILKMLYRDNDILIFDEPTAVLTAQEIQELLKIMRNLAEEGKTILFITHKLSEIKAVADRCTVIRKGKCIGTVNVIDATKEELSKMMVGRDVVLDVDKADSQIGDPVLKVSEMTIHSPENGKNLVDHVSFEVHQGEIVCIAGIDGNGQSELVQGITGLLKTDSGSVYMNGKDITKASIRERTLSGIGHIPEDRQKHGLVLDYNVGKNMILQTYYKEGFQKNGFLKFANIKEYAERLIKEHDVRCSLGPETVVRHMSGGNQQKIIFAREIDRNPDLMIAVQPTRGMDVGAIEYLYNDLIQYRNNKKAVLLVSLELDEVMSLSDRILVMYEGEIVADLKPGETNVQELGLYMSGAKRDESL